MLEMCRDAVSNRENASWEEKALYKYAPTVDPIDRDYVPQYITDELPQSREIGFRIHVFVQGEYLKHLNDEFKVVHTLGIRAVVLNLCSWDVWDHRI